ncbi:hypothetical protein GYMLUDRAFT_188580, partial [Collybiopsis luxurians FD-317 M1]
MVALGISSIVFETHATGLSLLNSAKCYRPLGREVGHDIDREGLVLMMAHGTGYHKEHWEPTIQYLFDLDLESKTTYGIRECWAIDVQNHGEAAVLNEQVTRETPEAWSIWDYADAFATLRRDILGSNLSYRDNKFVLIAHSASATGVILTTTFFPLPSLSSTFHSLILIEPAIAPNPSFIDPANHTPLYRQVTKMMASRKDTWASKDEAREWMKNRVPWGMWDERVLDLYVEFGLGTRKDGKGEVTLRCAKQTETLAYERGIRQSLPGLWQLNLLCNANAHVGDEAGMGKNTDTPKTIVGQPALPIHIVWGDIDDLFSREVKDALEDAEQGRVFTSVRRVEDAGHMVGLEIARTSILLTWYLDGADISGSYCASVVEYTRG